MEVGSRCIVQLDCYNMRDFKELEIWKIAREINKLVYSITRNFPVDEIYGLTNQLRRASVGVSSNIAEGCGRRTSRDFVQFLHNAMGSLKEVESQIFIAKDLNYLSDEESDELMEEVDKLGKKLNSFIQHIKGMSIK